MGRALHAPDGGIEEACDAGASLLCADPGIRTAVDAELLCRAEELVRRAWERGWQPADVVRTVRRAREDARPARLAADLIAAESRRYADEDLPPRWAAQLGELPGPLRSDGGPWFDAAARRESLDRFTLLSEVLALLGLLFRLPRTEPVGPVPGTGAGRFPDPPAATSPRGDEPKLLGRIRALLAKAEATGFPEEAEAFTVKAQQLMARHSIDEAMLAAGPNAPGDAPSACRIGVDRPYESSRALLLDAVAAANRCQAVWSGDLGFSTVVGYEADLRAVELLYTSLLVQATTAMSRAETGRSRAGRKRTKTFRQSFLVAYAGRIRERLTEAAEQAAGESAAGLGGRLLPVLAARETAVAGETERRFPSRTRHAIRGAGVRDAEGWSHGTAAADRARLPGGPTGPEGSAQVSRRA
ncbi:DUF2786 domain-containing protein [Streptomyces meridianus]|uniref:DUF2786 domain-containing protein n=1 Tax=Streptomyces meridianus TaxID=2938945 RepID=A0ABT0X5Q7_9ACTN|nr:DUF2786 domain-containing protein [Streptomyces meridianus]MCM2577665.1 DUF2786 domain-containing protein [Streptomyces meridianus]